VGGHTANALLFRKMFSHSAFAPVLSKSLKPGGSPGVGGGGGGLHAFLFVGLLPQRAIPSQPCEPYLVFFSEPGVRQQMLREWQLLSDVGPEQQYEPVMEPSGELEGTGV